MVTICPDTGFAGGAIAEPVFEVAVTPVNFGLSIAWPDQDALFYRVYIGTGPGSLQLFADNVQGLSYEIDGLDIGRQYYIQVTAVFSSQSSAASEIAEGELVNAPVFFGFVPTQTPNDSQISAMAERLQQLSAGSYTLTQSGSSENYPCFAFPAAFGVPSVFTFASFNYQLVESSLVIGGIPYNVFLNPFQTFSPSMAWTVA